MIAVAVTDTTQVAEARRRSAEQAKASGFDESDVGRVSIVATELASNLVKHASGGQLLVGPFEDATGDGIEILALDTGPGLQSVQECLRDGYSTAGSPGTGLGAVMRQAQLFDIASWPGNGTAVLARLQPRGQALKEATLRWGAVCLPKPGEEAIGDAWCAAHMSDGFAAMVADGLGHGPKAAIASTEAVRLFRADPLKPPATILKAVHNGLKETRGAAVTVARFNLGEGCIAYAGLGNIAGAVIRENGVQRLISHNGTAGLAADVIQEFRCEIGERFVVVLHSDGLKSGWSLDAYPGLFGAHPALIAGVLYRDFSRGRDDVTVLVIGGELA